MRSMTHDRVTPEIKIRSLRAVLGLLLCLVLGLGGCAKEGDVPLRPSPPQPPTTATLNLSASPDDVTLTAQWQDVSGPHVQTTRWRLPNGRLYEQQVQEFSGATTPVVSRLATIGTPISDRRLSGTWRVEVFLDDHPLPAASLSFPLGG